jgi:hypothetical protein
MLIGHYGPSFAARRADPSLRLWVFVLSAHLIDIAWTTFIIVGIEDMRIVPGYTRTNPLDLYYQPYSHGLPAAVGWAVAAAVVCRLVTGRLRSAALVGATVLSHWLLDLLVHRADLPLWDDQAKVGLGLWNYPLLTLVIEGTLAFGGIALVLARSASRRSRLRRGLPIVGVIVFGLQVGLLFSPPPPSPAALATMLLGFYVAMTATAAWLDRDGGTRGQVA